MFYLNKYREFAIRRLFDLIPLFYNPLKETLERNLAFCSQYIEFYRGKGEKLESYPCIDKKDVKENFDRLVYPGRRIKNTGITSGTTGTPGKFYRDIKSMAVEQYYMNRYFKWNGMYRVIFRGEKLFPVDYRGGIIYREVPLIGEMYVSSFHLNDTTMGNLVERLSKIKEKCLWAYPSSAYLLAEYCLRTGKKLNFDIVATSSEVLMEHQVKTIQKAFGCPVKDWYGSAERVAALYRCEYGSYHPPENYSHLELLPNDDSTYEVVGTTLHNKVMPLVRYNLHDLVELSKESCRCGCRGINITKIYGRKSGYIEFSDHIISETGLAIMFKHSRNIIEAQVIQKKDRHILVKVVRGEGFSPEDEKVLEHSVGEMIPEGMYRIEYVERIERDSRGKYRFVINESAG